MLVIRFLLFITLLFSIGSAFADNSELKVIDLKNRRAAEVLPVIKLILGDRGVATVLDDRLILRGSAQDLASVEKLLGQIDVKREMLRVAVRHDRTAGGVRSSAELSGRIDRSRRTLTNDPAVVVSGQGSRIIGNMRENVEQYLQVLDGEQAFIEVGRRVPYTTFRSYMTGRHLGFSEAIEYQDVTTGFFVRPHLLGEMVDMEITPHLSSVGSERDGVIEFETVTSRASIPLGEWFDLGGQVEQGSDVGRAILSIQAGENASVRRLWIKVTK